MEAYAEQSSVHADRPRPAVGATPSALARAVLKAFEQRFDMLETLLHPDADLETGYAVPGARFGAKSALDAGWVASNTGAYRPEYELVESLDEQ